MADHPKYTPDVQEQFEIYSVASDLLRERRGLCVKPSFEDLRANPSKRVQLIQVFDDFVNQRGTLTALSDEQVQASPYYRDEKAGWDHVKLGITSVIGLGGES